MKILYQPNEYSQQRQREKKRKIYPVLMAMEAQYFRNLGYDVYWDTHVCCPDKVVTEPLGISFLFLPSPDRDWTRWWEYQDNGNFKFKPATYMQVANGCWWGKCKFCVENKNKYEIRDFDTVINEVNECKRLGFREIFDDSGTFPTGKWLYNFCYELFKIDIHFSCNMRLIDIDYHYLKHCGFRMLLFGVESANQYTLDKIGKGTKTDDIKYIIKASKAGLEPHVAVMFGYPWETEQDAINTLSMVHFLLRKGYAKTAQASFYTPNGIESGNISHRKYVKEIYRVWKYPEFWWNKIIDIKCKEDIKYLWTSIKAGLS